MMIVKTLHFSQTFQKHVSTSRIKTNFFTNIRPRSVLKISNSASISEGGLLVDEFNPKIPVEKASTPPSSWYTNPSFLELELDRVFHRGWQVAGYTEQIKEAGDFFTGRLGNIEYVVCRDNNGELEAFHNVCRHHASLLSFGSGKKTCFTCPYHGWTYGLDGKLLKATRITGIKDFNVNEFGLVPIRVASWGPFILLNLDPEFFSRQDSNGNIGTEWLGSAAEILSANGVNSSLSYLCRREYTIECNWKVFCDNFLDGGYHVPYVHKALTGLNLESYSYSIFEKVSILMSDSHQMERQEDTDRLGSKPLYAFIYPNFMINWQGSWMNTVLVLPLGPRKCQVISDYSFDPSLKDAKEFIENSYKGNGNLQDEDITICEAVQKGLESPAYSSGRYAPMTEEAMHQFHCLVHENLAYEK
ncbi:Choline monooxygenase, chloroplastic [Heracleum sosnowskyi]|uniref:Choline monooxygenase, chloroplastic n=1 Tax=Heracleum sosnowskyi TaxID=360622 RepID=A0AAD8HI61_9APIA|nr:Choline monooxygenase, chloroplastic [Heracleum sosnowskyi]